MDGKVVKKFDTEIIAYEGHFLNQEYPPNDTIFQINTNYENNMENDMKKVLTLDGLNTI